MYRILVWKWVLPVLKYYGCQELPVLEYYACQDNYIGSRGVIFKLIFSPHELWIVVIKEEKRIVKRYRKNLWYAVWKSFPCHLLSKDHKELLNILVQVSLCLYERVHKNGLLSSNLVMNIGNIGSFYWILCIKWAIVKHM